MKKIIYSLLAVSFLAGSCNKQLDLHPTDTIDQSKAFQTVDDLQKGLYSVYAANNISNRIYIGSILADETKISNENRGQGQGTFKWQYSSTDGEQNANYQQYYNLIDQVHRILAVIDGITANSTDDETRKSRIKAELITMRGIAYYEMLTWFMPQGYDENALAIPLVLESSLLAQPARATVGEIVAQIESDLATGRAEANIPNAPDDVVRLSQSAIAAYQARLALLKKDYATAITRATESITLSGKTLATGADFVAFWQDANETESIWKYRGNATPQTLWTDTNGDVFFEPSDKLKDQFNRDNDIRFSTYFTIDESAADTALVNKYPGSALGPQINDLKLIRLSELYLIRAEAEAQSNQLTEAAFDINALRAARISGYTNIAYTGKDEAVADILNERFKELCFEGFRFFDLKRNSLGIDRLPGDVQSSVWQTLAANSFRFALPIPQHEVFANKSIVQNPGY